MPENLIVNEPFMICLPGESVPTGELHFWENEELFPGGIKRCFWISGVKEGETRGNHAHWKESQILVGLKGSLLIEIENIKGEKLNFSLSGSGKGLFIPPMHWVIVHFSTDSVLLGLSDLAFSEEDYIRDYIYFGRLQEKNH